MEATILNTDRVIFLVKFQFQITEGKFITDLFGLVDVLKTNDKNGVEYIKMFDPAKNKFKRASKQDILKFYTWYTEQHEYLTSHYYFK